ncbi:hypothetical protein AC578_7180 [Pseudocercospora eumusae]|uniref:Uncharacterized protein n=1 Tax=Pseudocercospora eumusae TaxID=321146 RepID=A0A139HWT6_9PEZI|nr:hypothetical protein AC578_7180 [Pseudocercospora eumusae]
MRLSNTAPTNLRVTNCNAQGLGCIVPKCTHVFLLQPGSVVDDPEIPCDDELRSKTSKDTSRQFGKFDPDTMARFMPERWLDLKGRKMMVTLCSANLQVISTALVQARAALSAPVLGKQILRKALCSRLSRLFSSDLQYIHTRTGLLADGPLIPAYQEPGASRFKRAKSIMERC